jgi:hypothetical protein
LTCRPSRPGRRRAVSEPAVTLGWQGRGNYTANTGSSIVSVYDATDPDKPKEIQAVDTSGPGALFQLALDPAERFLYVIDQHGSHAAPGTFLHGLAVDDEDGSLSELP